MHTIDENLWEKRVSRVEIQFYRVFQEIIVEFNFTMQKAFHRKIPNQVIKMISVSFWH